MFPRLFQFGNLSLPTYGVMAAAGLITGLLICVKLSRRAGIDGDDAWNLGIIAILSAIAGAKLLLILNDWPTYAANPRSIFSLSMLQAGGVFYGGPLGAIPLAYWYMRRRHMPALKTADCFAPGISFGHALGRLGCFAAGCCYGKPTDLPWGVVFTNPLANRLVGTPLGVRIHPTQIYEFLTELCIFSVLLWLLRRKHFDGQVVGAYMFLYGFARYFLEFVRGDPERGSVFNGAMTATQLISIGMVIAGGLLWMRWRRPAEPALSVA